MKFTCFTAACTILFLSFAGCSSTVQEQPPSTELSKWGGQDVRVQFRRDALGAAHTLPIGPDTGEINVRRHRFPANLFRLPTRVS